MHLITRLSHIGKSYRKLILVSTFVFAFVPFPVLAQTDTAEEEDKKEKAGTTVEEVVVSASRIPVPAQHVGSSVTVFDRNDIEKRQATRVYELLRESPGLAVSQQSFAGQTQLRIRGSEANHTLVLFDGIELSDPVSSDEFYLQHLPLFATDRIEVLRGPQSSLYGGESIGGVVNITSPIPEKGTTARLGMEQGTLRTTKLDSYIAFASEEHYGSVAMNQIQSKGISAKSDNTEADGMRQTSAYFKVGTQISESLGISATTLLVNYDGEYDGCGFPASNNCRSKDKKRASSIEVNYEQLDSNITHMIKLFGTRHKRNEFIKGVRGVPKVGRKSKIEYQAVVDWEIHDTNQTTVVALNKEKNEAIGQYVAGGRGGQFDTKSLVLEQRADLGNDIFASLSGRYDDNAGDEFENYRTYRGTLAWVVDDDLRIHTSAGTGVKNPQVSELFGWSSDWVANPNLKPETSRSWDLGAEFRLGLADLTFDLTYFNNKVTNLIEPTCGRNCEDNDPSDRTTFFNDISKSVNNPGESITKGWELSVIGSLVDTYEVSASATLSEGFKSTGSELIRRPSEILSLNISREFANSGKSGLMNFNIQYVGNQSDWNGCYDDLPKCYKDLPEYTLVNLGATLNLNSNLELTGKIDNLFNTQYSEVRGYNKPGQTIQVGLRYTF